MVIRKAHRTVFTPLEDGSSVLLDVTTLVYYGLNRTASAAWSEIERSETVELDDLAKTISNRFETDQAAASADLRSFLNRMASYQIVDLS
jgi:hypothetical protein